ncbi:MAG TPA: SMI1/KNR4 family protein [Tepidisphaeraceae bacterium]|jgi:hypothetical protein
MNTAEHLINAIRNKAQQCTSFIAVVPATSGAIGEAERSLGFPIPELLKAIYLEVGNGGFGPDYGIIGVRGGHASSAGTLVETLEDMIRGAEYLGGTWERHILPFCDRGCASFTCVDCKDSSHPIFGAEECVAHPMRYDLSTFFRRWVSDGALDASSDAARTAINPVTGEKIVIPQPRRP